MKTNNSTTTRASSTADLTVIKLLAHNQRFAGTSGVSAGNREQGFRPAFFDTDKGNIHLSKFADGRLAPMHILDGLPGDVVIRRMQSGRVVAVKSSLVSGFVRKNRFFTREQAAVYAAAVRTETAC